MSRKGAMQSIVEQASEEDLRIVKTRRALREALVELLEKTDYAKITVTAIAQTACVNRKTFYSHYRNVDDLVAEVIACNIEQLCHDALDDEPDGAQGVIEPETLTTFFLEAIDNSFDKQLSVLKGLGFLKLTEMIIDPMERIARDVCEQRGITPTDSLRSEIACYVGCVLAGYAQWRIDANGTETLDDVARCVNRMAAGLENGALH